MSCRVLVVEDEIFVAIEIENVIAEMGHNCVGIAADSTSALAKADEVELALVDLNLMDGPTGMAVGRALAAKGVTVMFMTANPTQLGAGIPGAIGVLAKPVNDRELRQAVEYLIALRRREKAATPPRRLTLFSQPPGALALA